MRDPLLRYQVVQQWIPHGLTGSMADDPDARVRIAALHAPACDRCKGDTCAPGPDRVPEPALHRLVSDPDPHVRAMAAELVGGFARSDARAVAALKTSEDNAPSPAVRKKAGWFAPGGTIYGRTLPSWEASGCLEARTQWRTWAVADEHATHE